MTVPLLDINGLGKRFGTVPVLNDVNFDLRAGEIHALLGANGAGKSTLCRIIAGLLTATSGSMTLDGAAYRPHTKQAAESAGVQIVPQELNLIPTLTVAENLQLTRLPARCGVIQTRRLDSRARQALDRFGLSDIDPGAAAGTLGVGRQQLVEITAALDRDCRILILDEPTAALTAGETERLFDWLRRLRQEGTAIIYISHRLEEIGQLADRVTILRDGRVVCTQPSSALSTDALITLMSGESADVDCVRNFRSHATHDVLLAVDQLSCGIVRDVSFSVRRGERFGIAGLVGSGRTELLRAIFGADPAEAGTVRLRPTATGGTQTSAAGRRMRFRHPAQAVRAGLAMVTEDRHQNGLLLTQPIRVNTTLSALAWRFSRGGLIRRRQEQQTVRELCESLEVRCNGIEQSAGTLSGGNQQRVAVAKWLVRQPDVILFDEPTRGIDVASRRRLYQLFDNLAARHTGIVIVSSDLDELLETCDRIGVMSAGRLVATFDRGEWSEDAIMQAAFSEYTAPSTRNPPPGGRNPPPGSRNPPPTGGGN